MQVAKMLGLSQTRPPRLSGSRWRAGDAKVPISLSGEPKKTATNQGTGSKVISLEKRTYSPYTFCNTSNSGTNF